MRNLLLTILLLGSSLPAFAQAIKPGSTDGTTISPDQREPTGGDTGKSNRLHQDLSVHPILKIKIGTKFGGSISNTDCQRLGEVGKDPNYLSFESEEREAAKTFCQLATAGKLDFLKGQTPNNGNGNVPYAVGFNRIPIRLTFRNQQCVSAIVLPVKGYMRHTESPFRGAENAGKLRHVVFNTPEFQGLNSRPVTDWEFRALNIEPGYGSYAETQHISCSDCFYHIEAEAALQFRQRVLGMRKDNLELLFGKPSVTDGSIIPWEKSQDITTNTTTTTNWIYYLGYSHVPVRLLFEHDYCVGASLLSYNQSSEYFSFMIKEFAGQASGKTEAEIRRLHGPPLKITEDLFGQRLLIYGIGRNAQTELSIKNGRVVGRCPLMALMGWKHRESF